MLIYLVRHAKAQPRIAGADHPQRCLTARGLEQAQQLATWLSQQTAKPNMLYSSPFRRCVDTAAPIATALDLPLHTVAWLSHGHAVQHCLSNLEQLTADKVQIWVGHEPELSNMLGTLFNRDPHEFSFSKAGIAALTRDQAGWRLLWQYRFKQLLAS